MRYIIILLLFFSCTNQNSVSVIDKKVDDMIKTTNHLELWEWFQNYEPEKGFMWSNHDNIAAISSGLDNNNHSGASFGICMRQIQ